MKRRRDLPLDTRLDWRDPNMPVLRLNNNHQMIEVKPAYVSNYYVNKINSPFYNAPHYKDDPTYFLKKLK